MQAQLTLGQLAAATGHHPALLAAAGLPAVIPSVSTASPLGGVAALHAGGLILAGGGGNIPCSTLFIANLGPMVNEEELREVFRSFPGFCRLRIYNKNGAPVAFVEYQVGFFLDCPFPEWN